MPAAPETFLLDGEEVEVTDEWRAALSVEPPPPEPLYVPLPVARRRLEAAGQWDAVAAILMENPAAMLRVLSLEQGVDPADPEARALLTAAGADPDDILAPVEA